MKLKKTMVVMIAMIAIIFLDTSIVHAETESESMPFTVEPILPSNQDPEIMGYISIKTHNDKLSQPVEFMIKNNTNKEQDVLIEVENAYTSPNSIIQYMNKATENSVILKAEHELRSYVEDKTQTITLKGDEERKVSIPVNVSSYEGTLLGGVSFIAPLEERDSESESGFQIENELKMLIGVVMEFNDVEVTEDMITFDEPYVDPMLSYYAVRLPTTYNGAKPKKFDLEYKVSHEGKELFFHEEEFTFAPKTKTNIPFPWDNESIKENEVYVLEGQFAHSDNSGKATPFKFEFSYDSKRDDNQVAKRDLRSPNVELDEKQIWILLLLVPLAGLVIFVFTRKREYVLELNEGDIPPEVVTSSDSLSDEMVKLKEYKNTDGKEFYIYKKKKDHYQKKKD